MNFKMYIILLIAHRRGYVKINPKYKDLAFMNKKGYISAVLDGSKIDASGSTVPTSSGYYLPTVTGRLAALEYGQKLVTWYIAVAALIISFIALAVSLL